MNSPVHTRLHVVEYGFLTINFAFFTVQSLWRQRVDAVQLSVSLSKVPEHEPNLLKYKLITGMQILKETSTKMYTQFLVGFN